MQTNDNIETLKTYFENKDSFRVKLNSIGLYRKKDNVNYEKSGINKQTIQKIILTENTNLMLSEVNSIIYKYVETITNWLTNNYYSNTIKKKYLEDKINKFNEVINLISTEFPEVLNNNDNRIKNIIKRSSEVFKYFMPFISETIPIYKGLDNIKTIKADILTTKQIEKKKENIISKAVVQSNFCEINNDDNSKSILSLYKNVSLDNIRFEVIAVTYHELTETKATLLEAFKEILKLKDITYRIQAIVYDYQVKAKIIDELSRTEKREQRGKNFEMACDTTTEYSKSYKKIKKDELKKALEVIKEDETTNKKAIDLITSDLNKLDLKT